MPVEDYNLRSKGDLTTSVSPLNATSERKNTTTGKSISTYASEKSPATISRNPIYIDYNVVEDLKKTKAFGMCDVEKSSENTVRNTTPSHNISSEDTSTINTNIIKRKSISLTPPFLFTFEYLIKMSIIVWLIMEHILM